MNRESFGWESCCVLIVVNVGGWFKVIILLKIKLEFENFEIC